VRKMGFDDVFLRVWNYYMTYCEAGFRSQTENCLILVFLVLEIGHRFP
jgi:cyclopropane-fatty-acyl-phospholipid synthase